LGYNRLRVPDINTHIIEILNKLKWVQFIFTKVTGICGGTFITHVHEYLKSFTLVSIISNKTRIHTTYFILHTNDSMEYNLSLQIYYYDMTFYTYQKIIFLNSSAPMQTYYEIESHLQIDQFYFYYTNTILNFHFDGK